MPVGIAARLGLALRQSVLFKALGSYASGAWVLLEVVSTFIEGLGLPDWVFEGVVTIVVCGLPVIILAVANSGSGAAALATAPAGLMRQLTLKRAAIGGSAVISAFAAVVVLFMASWAFGVGPAASLLASGSLKHSDPVLISDFENRSADPNLGSTITEVIRLDLSQSNVVRVLDRDQVDDALERMNRDAEAGLNQELARELAIREGMPAVLEGEVSALGPATIITARLVEPREGTVMAEYAERAESPDELLNAVDRLSSTLRNKIGEPLTSIRPEPPLEKVTTASLDALRAYTEANAAHAAGKEEEATQLLRTALAHDPSFPMAWRKLGTLLGDSDPVAARQAYSNAFRLRDDLPERERQLAIGSYFKNVEGDLSKAIDAYRRVLKTHPDDHVALTNLANLFTAFQKPHEAIKLYERVIKIRPRYAAHSNLFNALVRTGQISRAKQVYEESAQLYPTQKRIKLQPIMLALAEGDLRTADRLFERFLRESAGREELLNDVFVARYHWRRGRLDEARRIFRERARRANAKGDAATAIEAMTSLVSIAHANNDPDQARALIHEMLREYPLEPIPEVKRPHIDLAIAYAQAGQPAEARSHLELALKQGPQHGSLNYNQRQRAVALIAHAEGRYGEAVQLLSESSRFGQCGTCVLFDLGLSAEAAGQQQAAIAAYERFLKLAPAALGRAENLGFVLARLADLQERAGQTEAARAHRAQLQVLWSAGQGQALADRVPGSVPGGG